MDWMVREVAGRLYWSGLTPAPAPAAEGGDAGDGDRLGEEELGAADARGGRSDGGPGMAGTIEEAARVSTSARA
jgi:hypothetical protein